jgi:sugar lactone lactonase YvrE
MMQPIRRISGVSCLLAAAVVLHTAAAFGQIHAGTHPVPAVTKQIIKAFDNPEGAIFSADGRFVFVTNAAEIGGRANEFAWTEGEGYISKLEVLPSGELRMVKDKLITGLTAPLGMAVLPLATSKFPAGTIFACVGSAPMRDRNGLVITDPKRLRTKLLAFDVDGRILGEIDTGEGSIVQQINGSPIILINALGFDKSGNLYVADTAFGGVQFNPPFEGKGGLWIIPHAALDDLAGGRTPAQKPVFLAIPGNPDGVEVSPRDGKIYVNTVGPVAGAPDPARGGIYALTPDDIKRGRLPEPVDRDLGALDGLDFTSGGTMLNTQIRGDVPASILVNCPGQKATVLSIQPTGSTADLTGPADIAVRRLGGGAHLVVVPELFARDATPGDDEVTVLALPQNFDAACGR